MIKTKRRRQAFKIKMFAIVFCVSCNINIKNTDLIPLKMFSLNANSLKSMKILSQSKDGYHGILLINDKDTVYFNFGYDISNLAEEDPAVIYYPYDEKEIRDHLDTTLVDPNNIVYTKKSNFDIDEFRKQNVFFEVIDGYKAKITVPRQIENGVITGMYIDSLRKDDGGRLKFNFYSKYLDSAQSQNFLQIVKSIHFNFLPYPQ